MKLHLLKLKTELKAQVIEIKELKAKRTYGKNQWCSAYMTYRSKHIAYCLLRGTPMEMIESSHRDPNIRSHELVKKRALEIMQSVQKEVHDEDIRLSGQTTI